MHTPLSTPRFPLPTSPSEAGTKECTGSIRQIAEAVGPSFPIYRAIYRWLVSCIVPPRISEALAKSGNFPDDVVLLSMEIGARNGIQMRSFPLNDRRQARSIADGPQRIGADIDKSGHRPGTFD